MSTNRYDLVVEETQYIRNSASLLYVSSAKYGGDWNSVPHAHTCTELFYVVGGEGRFQILDQVFPVSTGDLVIINPNIQHTEISLDAKPLEYIVLGIDGLEFSLDSEQLREQYIVHIQDDRPEILSYLCHMLSEIVDKAPGYETVCQKLLDIFLICLIRHANFPAVVASPAGRGSKGCTAVRRYIDLHFTENLTLDLLAEVSHTNKFHMSHRFKKEYGVSPIRYMQALRIQESCQLLRSTDYSLSQIALFLGFSSPSYFSQSFRKLMGMSPIQYRAEQQNRS